MTTRTNAHLPPHLSCWVPIAFAYVYVAWGATYLALHFALQSLPPFLLSGARFTTAGVVLLGLLAVLDRRGFRLGTVGEWRDALVVGSLLLVGGNGCVAWAQQYVNTSTAALIFGSIPLCINLFDWIRPNGTPVTLRTGIGLALGFAGLCVIIKPAEATTESHLEIWGKLALVVAACSWSVGAIYSRHVHATGSPLLPMARQMLLGGLVLLAIGGARGDFGHVSPGQVTLASWLGFGYLVVFGSLLGFTAYVWLMRVSTTARISTISYMNTVVAVLLGWTLGSEPMTVRIALGGAIIIGSVVLVLTKKPAPVDAPPPEA